MSTSQLSDLDIRAEIVRFSSLLDRQVTEVAKRARAAADAEADHKVAFAKAYLAADGPVAEREAKATVATETTLRAYKSTSAVLMAAQEAGRSYRSQMDSLRSLSAAQRHALTYAEGVGA